jgi:hypothetical protein
VAFTEDLDAFVDVDEFAVSVIIGGTTGTGILDQNSDVTLGGEVVFIDYILTARTSFAGSLTYGDVITVSGSPYKVEMQPLRIDDGAFCRVPLVATSLAANNITTLDSRRLVTLDGRYLITL